MFCVPSSLKIHIICCLLICFFLFGCLLYSSFTVKYFVDRVKSAHTHTHTKNRLGKFVEFFTNLFPVWKLRLKSHLYCYKSLKFNAQILSVYTKSVFSFRSFILSVAIYFVFLWIVVLFCVACVCVFFHCHSSQNIQYLLPMNSSAVGFGLVCLLCARGAEEWNKE